MIEKQLELLRLDVSAYTEKKGNLTYLSWSHAWGEFLKVFPDATYDVKKDENGQCWFGNPEHGYMVYTTVTVDGLSREMWLPVMDHRNKAVKNPDAFQINKAVMRCLTKNLAVFGLGLFIYQGSDLPEAGEPSELDKIKDATSHLYADVRGKFIAKYEGEGQTKLDEALGFGIKKVTEIGKSGDESRITELYDLLKDLEV